CRRRTNCSRFRRTRSIMIFFSSRRRHTRSYGDWSSDVCSSDLKLHTEWYDWAMKGGAKPEFLKKRVAYYLVGAEEWKYADRLESISNATRTLVLGSNGEASDVFRSGTLTEGKPGAFAAMDSWTYDPLD